MPRSMALRTSSVRLQWLRGRSLCSDGCSQDRATIAQICSGVKVAGAPGRGASDSRAAAGVDAAAVRRTAVPRPVWTRPRCANGLASDVPSSATRRVGGQSRAHQSRPRPTKSGAPARPASAGWCGRARQTGQQLRMRGGYQDRFGRQTGHRDLGESQGETRCALPYRGRFDSPRSGKMQAVRHDWAPTVACQTHPSPARWSRDFRRAALGQCGASCTPTSRDDGDQRSLNLHAMIAVDADDGTMLAFASFRRRNRGSSQSSVKITINVKRLNNKIGGGHGTGRDVCGSRNRQGVRRPRTAPPACRRPGRPAKPRPRLWWPSCAACPATWRSFPA